jgi:hypothetical protein
MNKDGIIKKILDQHKPDEQQAMQVIAEANKTIELLSNVAKTAEARWTEIFIMLDTVLNHFGKEIRLTEVDMVALSPQDYQITIEPVKETGERIIRLRHITHKEEKDDSAT